jgi:polysaccharide pyruvyl transferase WcaK-like protein
VSVALLLARTSPAARIAFHYGNSTGGSRRLSGSHGDVEVEVQNCRLSLLSPPGRHLGVILFLAALYRLGIRGPARGNAWLSSLLNARFIGEIRGGDSFSDIYGLRRFVEGCLPLISVVLIDRPFVMLPQTYGPFRSRAARWLAGVLLRHASVVMTRDRHCEAIVRDLCGRTPLFCPDVAFTLEPIRPVDLPLAPDGLSLAPSELVVGVNISGLLYMGGYTGRNAFGLRAEYRQLVDQLVERILSSTAAKVLLVPHVFGSEMEEEACAEILKTAGARFPGRVFTITRSLTEREIKWVIGQTQFFIGSRMHGCIAALSQCVPAIGLAYSDKFLGVFQSVGAGDFIVDLRQADTADVIQKVLSTLEHREALREQLQARIPAIQEQIAETFRKLVQGASERNG